MVHCCALLMQASQVNGCIVLYTCMFVHVFVVVFWGWDTEELFHIL